MTEVANFAGVVDSDDAVLYVVNLLSAGAAAVVGVVEVVVQKTEADGATVEFVLADLIVEDDSAGDGKSGFDLGVDEDFVADCVVLVVVEMECTGDDEYSADNAHSGVAV